MTDAEWLISTDPEEMLAVLCGEGKLSERKARLFDCACCRLAWHLLEEVESEQAVEAAERYADGLIDRTVLLAAGAAAAVAEGRVQQDTESEDSPARLYASWAATEAADGHAGFAHRRHFEPYRNVADALANKSHPKYFWRQDGSLGYGSDDPNWPGSRVRHRAEALTSMAALLRDIVGNPFRPPRLDPSLRTPAVVRLAQVANDDRLLPAGHLVPARLGELADGLEDAGCSDADLYTHLRGPGLNVRGCWAVDLVLDRR